MDSRQGQPKVTPPSLLALRFQVECRETRTNVKVAWISMTVTSEVHIPYAVYSFVT